jgi:hypothetical protein
VWVCRSNDEALRLWDLWKAHTDRYAVPLTMALSQGGSGMDRRIEMHHFIPGTDLVPSVRKYNWDAYEDWTATLIRWTYRRSLKRRFHVEGNFKYVLILTVPMLETMLLDAIVRQCDQWYMVLPAPISSPEEWNQNMKLYKLWFLKHMHVWTDSNRHLFMITLPKLGT